MVRARTIAVALVMTLIASSYVSADSQFGRFVGELVLKFGPGDRDAIVFSPFSYIGPDGREWPVPVNTVVNGASIPRPLWSIIGSPFTGLYRRASVIHDYYCEIKSRTWRDVHRVFYDGMRAGGVSEIQAKVMYAAVYSFGPKWKTEHGVDGSKIVTFQPAFDQERFEEIQAWVKANNPSEAEIEALVK